MPAPHYFFFFFSIADILWFVETLSRPYAVLYPGQQFRLAPATLQSCVQIPCPLLHCLTALQDRHILRPRQPQRLFELGRCVSIGQIERPHTAQITGRKAFPLRVSGLEVFRGYYRRTFFRPGAHGSADLTVQPHLWQAGTHQLIQSRIQRRIISGFTDVHRDSFPTCMPFPESRKEKTGHFRAGPLFAAFAYITCTICSHRRTCLSSIALLSCR